MKKSKCCESCIETKCGGHAIRERCTCSCHKPTANTNEISSKLAVTESEDCSDGIKGCTFKGNHVHCEKPIKEQLEDALLTESTPKVVTQSTEMEECELGVKDCKGKYFHNHTLPPQTGEVYKDTSYGKGELREKLGLPNPQDDLGEDWEKELKRKFFVRNGEGNLQANSSPELFHYIRDFIKQKLSSNTERIKKIIENEPDCYIDEDGDEEIMSASIFKENIINNIK